MTDARRSDKSSLPGEVPDRERDARIEALLLTGLDHYFAGQHELAINIWTRVLFLDRGHARARAYIERARGAVAEHQREGDELFHTGADALNRGDRATARQLLTSAVERGTSGEEALVLLHRLDRLEAAGPNPKDVASARAALPERSGAAGEAAPRSESRVAWLAGGIVAGILIAALAGGYLWIAADPFDLDSVPAALPTIAESPLPVPTMSEIRLTRARNLLAKGQPHSALALLEAGEPDERHRADYDALRASIQRGLLEAGRAVTPAAAR